MNKRISDIVAETLVELGIKDCFTLVGGGAMHLNDAFGNNAGIKCTYFLHEQAATIAAEGYARVDGNMPVVCVTTGPGGTNALTGVLCAWLDSIPMIVVSGQVKTTSSVSSTGLQLRQFGEQEYNIVESVKPMTKYAVMVTSNYSVLPGRTPSVWPNGQPAPSKREPIRRIYAPKASLLEGGDPRSGSEGVRD